MPVRRFLLWRHWIVCVVKNLIFRRLIRRYKFVNLQILFAHRNIGNIFSCIKFRKNDLPFSVNARFGHYRAEHSFCYARLTVFGSVFFNSTKSKYRIVFSPRSQSIFLATIITRVRILKPIGVNFFRQSRFLFCILNSDLRKFGKKCYILWFIFRKAQNANDCQNFEKFPKKS